jgi:hypothetical protein
MAVEVESTPTFRAGLPKALFRAPTQENLIIGSTWDLAPDGSRFLFAAPPPEQDNEPFNLVLNWTSLLKK